jgi:hypothetical protein
VAEAEGLVLGDAPALAVGDVDAWTAGAAVLAFTVTEGRLGGCAVACPCDRETSVYTPPPAASATSIPTRMKAAVLPPPDRRLGPAGAGGGGNAGAGCAGGRYPVAGGAAYTVSAVFRWSAGSSPGRVASPAGDGSANHDVNGSGFTGAGAGAGAGASQRTCLADPGTAGSAAAGIGSSVVASPATGASAAS